MMRMSLKFLTLFIFGVFAAAGAGYYFGYDIGYEKAVKDKAVAEVNGNASEKAELIRVTTPQPNQVVQSPLIIKGEARGYWFFEASFPVKLVDANGKNIPLDPPYIMAKGEWMTEDFVSFEAILRFEKPETKTGTLILVTSDTSRNIEQSARNLPYAKVLSAKSLNVLDVLNHKYLFLLQDAVPVIKEHYKI